MGGNKTMIVYKLFGVRKNGTIRSLFINRKRVLPIGEWLVAESHPTKGYALRPFWHCTSQPIAPHLSEKNRKWYKVEMKDYEMFKRPESQGGIWYLAKKIKILEEYKKVIGKGKIRVNYSGKTFGRLTILNEYKRTNKNTLWKVKCICGNIKWVYVGHLKCGTTLSCGCLRTENAIKQRSIYRPSAPLRREDGASAFITLFNNYRKKAIKRNIVFQLTPDQFKDITKKNCHYCNCPPHQKVFGGGRTTNGSGAYIYNGIDRKDNGGGYTILNSLPCCGICNYMKMSMGYDEFINHIIKIINNQNKKNDYPVC